MTYVRTRRASPFPETQRQCRHAAAAAGSACNSDGTEHGVLARTPWRTDTARPRAQASQVVAQQGSVAGKQLEAVKGGPVLHHEDKLAVASYMDTLRRRAAVRLGAGC